MNMMDHGIHCVHHELSLVACQSRFTQSVNQWECINEESTSNQSVVGARNVKCDYLEQSLKSY
jgi:hypothetical protein